MDERWESEQSRKKKVSVAERRWRWVGTRKTKLNCFSTFLRYFYHSVNKYPIQFQERSSKRQNFFFLFYPKTKIVKYFLIRLICIILGLNKRKKKSLEIFLLASIVVSVMSSYFLNPYEFHFLKYS